jgi:hypothetical protein
MPVIYLLKMPRLTPIWHLSGTIRNTLHIEHMFYAEEVKRHVWVHVSDQHPPAPGLLLEWRKAGNQWEGLVTVLTKSNAHKDYDGTATVWYPASRLTPA